MRGDTRMKNYGHFKHIEGIFREVIWESFANARDMWLNFKDVYELADGIEVDMQEDFRNRLNIGDDDFDTNDCEWIIAHNAYDMLALQAAVKNWDSPISLMHLTRSLLPKISCAFSFTSMFWILFSAVAS